MVAGERYVFAENPVSRRGTAPGKSYALEIVRYHTPFSTTDRLRFAEDQLFVRSEHNVGPEKEHVAELVGRAAPVTTSSSR